MKKFILLFSLLFLMIATTVSAEKIDDFAVDIDIHQDASITVKEKILYNFEANQRHGIFRDIPLYYKTINGEYSVEISNISVVDEKNSLYTFTTSEENGVLKIKIGDANSTVTGQKIYQISYNVKNALGFFDNHDELYWNATGNGWQSAMAKASLTLKFSGTEMPSNIQHTCYTGVVGSNKQDCKVEVLPGKTGLLYTTTKALNSKEGITIVAGWPKNIIAQPDYYGKEAALPGTAQNLPKPLVWILAMGVFFNIGFPIVCLVFLLFMWFKYGKERKFRGAIVAEYAPPLKMKPAELALVKSFKINFRDVSAVIIDLAVRGFLTIKEKTKKSFILVKAEGKGEMEDYEKLIYDEIFKKKTEVEMNTLNLTSVKAKVQKMLFSKIEPQNIFEGSPAKVRAKYYIPGIIMAVIGFVMPMILFSFIIAGIMFIIFSLFMPRRSEQGTEVYRQILGFKDYLETAEKYRLQFAEDEKIFEKYLPYAIVFDIVDKWAKAFEGVYKTQPEWYEGNFSQGFNTVLLASALNGGIRSYTAAAYGSAGGSGHSSGFSGGSSGGGGGGGGGGSW